MSNPAQPAIGVIGAGRWGRLHAQKLRALSAARLAVVMDPDRRRAERLGEELGVPAVTGWHEMPPLDAVTVATPLPTLASVTAEALTRGLHVLCEKPLALSAQAAQGLVEQADAAGLHLRVGYLERFNLAVAERQPRHRWQARRVGPRMPEALLLDWMVHDLDLALWLTDGPLRVQSARQASGRLAVRLEGAASIELIAGRAGAVSRGFEDAAGWVDLNGPNDALAAQLGGFVDVLLGGSAPALATGADAVRVLRLVADIERRLR
jgi:predicted dehydrogenase